MRVYRFRTNKNDVFINYDLFKVTISVIGFPLTTIGANKFTQSNSIHIYYYYCNYNKYESNINITVYKKIGV